MREYNILLSGLKTLGQMDVMTLLEAEFQGKKEIHLLYGKIEGRVHSMRFSFNSGEIQFCFFFFDADTFDAYASWETLAREIHGLWLFELCETPFSPLSSSLCTNPMIDFWEKRRSFFRSLFRISVPKPFPIVLQFLEEEPNSLPKTQKTPPIFYPALLKAYHSIFEQSLSFPCQWFDVYLSFSQKESRLFSSSWQAFQRACFFWLYSMLKPKKGEQKMQSKPVLE